MKKCCLSTLISMLVIVVLVAAAVIVVLNLTPAQLHVDTISIGGSTLADAGLADVKIIKIIKGFKSLNKKESDVVANGYDTEEQQSLSAGFFENSSLSGANNYASLLDTAVTFDGRYALVMNDTTLAYIFNSALAAAFTNESGENAASALSVREVTITKTVDEGSGATTGHMRIVVGVDTNGYIPDAVREALDKVKVVKVPQYLYLVFDGDFDVLSTGANQGKMVFGTTDVSVGGDKDNVLNDVLVGLFAKAMGTENESNEDNKAALCNAIFDRAAACVNHIGAIGSAYTNPDGVVTGTVTYGMAGVDDHKLRFVTYTDALI